MEDIPEPRQRKKKLINEVKELLEFYFSPANVGKDRFMQNLLSSDEYIDIEVFHKFNKIKNLTNDTKILQKAVGKSEILELSEDKLKVKRSLPLQMKENEMECTIYVENLPPNSTHDWLQKVFSLYGIIDYISLPKFQQSGRPKGFAFVEFSTPQEAQKALEAFGGLASLDGTLNPSELLTIKTYGKIEDTNENNDSTTLDKSEDIGGCASTSINEKKRPHGDDSEEDESLAKKMKLSSEEGSKKKKKRKRNKKGKEYELDSVYLRVMSKKDWKTLRNKYLDVQKENMKQLKEIVRYQSQNWDSEEKSKPKRKKPTYTPEVIVKITLNEPPQDPKEFMEGVTNGRSTIAYVDVSAETRDVFIRFKNSNDAKNFVKEGLWESVHLLNGDEELDYWLKLTTCWDLKRPYKGKQKKLNIQSDSRGREKLIQRAFKIKSNENHHIIFTSDDEVD